MIEDYFLAIPRQAKPHIRRSKHTAKRSAGSWWLNPRVFGSVIGSTDTNSPDLNLLINPAEGMRLFDMAAIAAAAEQLVRPKVDVRTPDELSKAFRDEIVAEARPFERS